MEEVAGSNPAGPTISFPGSNGKPASSGKQTFLKESLRPAAKAFHGALLFFSAYSLPSPAHGVRWLPSPGTFSTKAESTDFHRAKLSRTTSARSASKSTTCTGKARKVTATCPASRRGLAQTPSLGVKEDQTPLTLFPGTPRHELLLGWTKPLNFGKIP